MPNANTDVVDGGSSILSSGILSSGLSFEWDDGIEFEDAAQSHGDSPHNTSPIFDTLTHPKGTVLHQPSVSSSPSIPTEQSSSTDSTKPPFNEKSRQSSSALIATGTNDTSSKSDNDETTLGNKHDPPSRDPATRIVSSSSETNSKRGKLAKTETGHPDVQGKKSSTRGRRSVPNDESIRPPNPQSVSSPAGNSDSSLGGETKEAQEIVDDGLTTPLLHIACHRGGDKAIIACLLQLDRSAAARPVSLVSTKISYDVRVGGIVSRPTRENYQQALNLAIQNHAPADVIEGLLEAAPHVIGTPDGHDHEGPMHVMLKYINNEKLGSEKYADVIDLMLLYYPAVCAMTDRHDNTPLHVACMYGAPIDVVRHLCLLYPAALDQRNFNGLTPLDIIRRSSRQSANSDEVADYMIREIEHLSIPDHLL